MAAQGPTEENIRKKHLLMLLLLAVLALAARGTGAAAETAGYLAVTGPCHLAFPGDHGPHPGFRTEWWYYTGNVRAADGRRFGFQLTFFRRQISPPGAEKTWPVPASAWRTSQIYMAHAAVSDLDGKRYLHADRAGRAALGMAGSVRESGRTRIYLNDWSATVASDTHALRTAAGNFALDLRLKPVKPPVMHGEAGYSRKGSAPGNASCYYSLTRLETRGTITIDGRPLEITGSGWMDHEFSSELLEPETVGWDWFSLQMNDGTELMLFMLRRKDGTMAPASSGTFVTATGGSRHLALDDFSVAVTDTWQSPHSGGVYPAGWQLTIDRLDLDLTVTANLADQEMRSPASTGVTYWEGSVTARGTAGGRPVRGAGYVELTGYAGAFDAPL